MARVHLAMTEGRPDFTKLIVVKELKHELFDDAEFVKMFHDEARVSARLTHPNIVQTYDVLESRTQLALLMEYVEGLSLTAVLKRVKRRNFPVELYVRVLSEMLAGLHYAHELTDFDGHPLHLVHRDVSPHNVMISYGGHVKLLDFGIAKARGALSQTAEGTIKGKFAYMSPEGFVGKADRRSDVFAVGIMLWEGITRERAGFGRPEAEIAAMRVSGTEPSASDLAPEAPRLLLDVCAKAMARDPADRHQTAEDLRLALEPYLAEVGSAASVAELARFMTEHFSEERDRIRQVIADRAAEPPTTDEDLVLMADEPSSSTALRRGVHTQSLPGSEARDGSPSRRWWRWWPAAIALFVAGAAAAAVHLERQPGKPPAAIEPGPSAPAVGSRVENGVAGPPAAEPLASAPAMASASAEGGGDHEKPRKPGRAGSGAAPPQVRKPDPLAVATTTAKAGDAKPPTTAGDPITTSRKPRNIDADDPYKQKQP